MKQLAAMNTKLAQTSAEERIRQGVLVVYDGRPFGDAWSAQHEAGR